MLPAWVLEVNGEAVVEELGEVGRAAVAGQVHGDRDDLLLLLLPGGQRRVAHAPNLRVALVVP